jgi:serine/threonine protein kinase
MLLREMKHDSVVRLVDVFEDAEYVHLVTDLFTGGELFDRIVQKSNEENGAACFAEDEAARVLHQVLRAVSYMHRRGIVHRDIKPENIMFESKEEGSPIKIIDFGLARKHHGRYGEPPMSTVVGTPYYIAPDVLRKKYDNSCDLWSVGVIAYILLCGYPPFNGGNNEETHAAVLRGRYRFPAREWRGTSPEARDFVRGLLQMNASKRMTVEQALEHPWMRRHVDVDDDEAMTIGDEENRAAEMWSEKEAVVKGARMPMKASVLCNKLARGTKRVSAFGKRLWLAELQEYER